MCRSIKTQFHTDRPPTETEIYAASLQFVRKVSGYRQPSKVNQDTFEQAAQDIARTTQKLMNSLEMSTPVRERK